MKIWIIGAGTIAQEYAKVLNVLGYDYIVIGRGEQSAKRFKNNIGKDVILGGLDYFLSTNPTVADKAIVATNLYALSNSTIQLIDYGVKEILCEKPGFLYPFECQHVVNAARTHNSKVFLAYNRRFFSSVLKAQEIIEEDGGILSFNFEFTEWGHVIEKAHKSQEDLKNWFFANSSHVVDLAFFIGGNPIKMNCFTSGEISWHKPAVFAGSGITELGALFNYCANWSAPGRWGIEFLTSKSRLYLRPMEKLQIQKKGSVSIIPVDIDDHLDIDYKPGFFLETKSFVESNYKQLCTIEKQLENINNIYCPIISL